jgi:hypothetical protein
MADDGRAPGADVVDVALAVGVPPTERKARTGELTPPGVVCWARANRMSFLEVETVCAVVVIVMFLFGPIDGSV